MGRPWSLALETQESLALETLNFYHLLYYQVGHEVYKHDP